MRLFAIVTVLVTIGGAMHAQESRTAITSPAVAQEDQRPNSESVPAGYSIPTNFQRVLIVRLKYGTDLLDGLDSLIHQEHIHNGIILAGIGSVRNYRYHTVGNRTFPSQDVIVSNPTAPADIASMNGYIVAGRIHTHITFSDPNHAFGGHLEKGTNVFTFAIVTIGILADGTDIKRIDDKTFR